MTHMNGDALCRAIRADPSLSRLPVLVLSALERAHDLRVIFRAGASDFLPKPFVKEVFLSRVAALLQGHAAAEAVRERLVTLTGEAHYRQALRRFGHTAPAAPAEPAEPEALRA
jgi:DNA-binding response OmpR family regulator